MTSYSDSIENRLLFIAIFLISFFVTVGICNFIQTVMEHLSKKEKRMEKKRKKFQALAEIVGYPKNDEPNPDEPETKKTKPEDQRSMGLVEEITSLRRFMRERKRTVHPPKIILKPLGENAHLDRNPNQRTPIFITDIPNLLTRIFLNEEAPEDEWPWYRAEHCNNITTVVVLVIEGISLFHFQMYPQCFESSLIYFDTRLETLLPPYKGKGEIIEEIISCPLTLMQKTELIKRYDCLEVAKLYCRQNPLYLTRTLFPIELPPSSNQSLPETDKFPRTQLLLSPIQLVGEQYPVPMNGFLSHRYKHYAMSCDVYAEVTPSSPMFGVDCEMVKTCKGINELARISIVDESYKSVYESLICPKSVIIDYLTPHSGITKELLKDVTKSVEQMQKEVRAILPPDAILVGHSLQNDLIAMKMFHPYVIDTSVIYSLTGIRKYKSKLKTLMHEFLGESIQSERWHDSTEDAVAALKLCKLKLSQNIEFGDEVIKAKRRSHSAYSHLLNQPEHTSKIVNNDVNASGSTELRTNLLQSTKNEDYRIAVVASEATNYDHRTLITGGDDSKKTIAYHRTTKNKGAIKKTSEIANDHDMVVTHIKIQSDDFEPANVEERLKKVDSHVSTIRKSLNANSLMAVILGGTPGASTGVFMFGIKKRTPNSLQ